MFPFHVTNLLNNLSDLGKQVMRSQENSFLTLFADYKNP